MRVFFVCVCVCACIHPMDVSTLSIHVTWPYCDKYTTQNPGTSRQTPAAKSDSAASHPGVYMLASSVALTWQGNLRMVVGQVNWIKISLYLVQ